MQSYHSFLYYSFRLDAPPTTLFNPKLHFDSFAGFLCFSKDGRKIICADTSDPLTCRITKVSPVIQSVKKHADSSQEGSTTETAGPTQQLALTSQITVSQHSSSSDVSSTLSASTRMSATVSNPATRPRLQLSPELQQDQEDDLESPKGTPLTTVDYGSLLKIYTPTFPGGRGQRNLLLALTYLSKS